MFPSLRVKPVRTGLLSVRPETEVVVPPKVNVLEPRVSVELANLTFVTLPSTIFAVVTVSSVGVRVSVNLASVSIASFTQLPACA